LRKPKLKEVGMFPKPCESGHNFQPLNDVNSNDGENHIRGYYKEDARGNRISKTVYGLLFCSRCGETKEITIVNRRR
jgi:hypothetical protein